MKNTGRYFSVGVDLGATNLRVASYSGEGKALLETIQLPTRLSEGRDRVIRDMCEAIAALRERSYGNRQFAGVGVGAPGPLELPDGILRNPPNLPGWDAFNFRNALESKLGYPVEIESDANVAALAESRIGAGREHDVDSLCVLTLGTGVGSGFILNRDIWHGSTGMGGEAGHIVVEPEGVPCGCGGNGCLEQYASATAVVRMAREHLGADAPGTSHELALLAASGHPDAVAIFETVGHALAIGLTALVNTLNLQLYLLGGGVCEAWDVFAPAMFRELRKRSYVYRLTEPSDLSPNVLQRHKTYILPAQMGSTAGLLGACLLPLQATSHSVFEEGAVGAQ